MRNKQAITLASTTFATLPVQGQSVRQSMAYDAWGALLNPDPEVQLPDNTQNYNRYSYCLNTPVIRRPYRGVILTIFPHLICDWAETRPSSLWVWGRDVACVVPFLIVILIMRICD